MIFLTDGLDYSSFPLCGQGTKWKVLVQIPWSGTRHEVRRRALVLGAAYGCTRMSEAKLWSPLCMPDHEPLGLCLPSGAPSSKLLKGTLWANSGTVCLRFVQSGWHRYFLISVKLLYFTSHIISKRSFRIHWTIKDFLNCHIRHNNTTTILHRNKFTQ